MLDSVLGISPGHYFLSPQYVPALGDTLRINCAELCKATGPSSAYSCWFLIVSLECPELDSAFLDSLACLVLLVSPSSSRGRFRHVSGIVNAIQLSGHVYKDMAFVSHTDTCTKITPFWPGRWVSPLCFLGKQCIFRTVGLYYTVLYSTLLYYTILHIVTY